MIGCHTVGRETIDGWIPDATPVEESIRLVSSSTGEIQDMRASNGSLFFIPVPFYTLGPGPLSSFHSLCWSQGIECTLGSWIPFLSYFLMIPLVDPGS